MDNSLVIFSVPGGALQEPPIDINITAIVEKEQRLDDVARINSHTAPELLSTFNRCWLDLDKLCVFLTDAKNKAKNSIDNIEGQLGLECTEEVLIALGHHKASADLRKSWVACQDKLINAKERLTQISTVLDYCRGKQQAFKNGYESVKKLINPQLPIDSNPGKMPEAFSTPRPKPTVVEDDVFDIDDELPTGFGKLKL